MANKKISLISISYNDSNKVIELINNFTREKNEVELSIFIIDNYKALLKNDLSIYYSRDFNEIEFGIYISEINRVNIYIVENMNTGFAKSNNLGYKLVKKYEHSMYVLFINPDMVPVVTPVEFTNLFKLASKKNIGVVGVKIKNLDDTITYGYRYLSFTRRWVLRIFLYPFIPSKLYNDEIVLKKSDFCYRVRGSFLFFESEVFEKINGFDDTTFMYSEESILSERLNELDLKCYYYEDIEMIHNHEILSKISCKKLKNQFVSELYFYTKYKHINKFVALITKLFFPFYIFKVKIVSIVRRLK